MSFRNWIAPLVATGFFGVIAVGCSSSAAGPAPNDAASEVVGRKLLDDAGGLTSDDGGDDGGASFDKTTGKPCASDTDCAAAGGPGVNVCSNGFAITASGGTFQVFSTPVCILPPTSPNCDPLSSSFCDSPGDATSPGLCVPFDTANPQRGQGICYPKCTFALDGSKPTGCAGTNVCNPVGSLRGPPVIGVGYCTSGCQADSDCAALGAGYLCQTDLGVCGRKKVTRTKAFGDSCTSSRDGGVDDNTTGSCNCIAGASGAGFCSSACVTGGTPCPNQWVCDPSQSPMAGTATLTMGNVGLSGLCLPPCMATDAGSTVPEASTGIDAASDAAPTQPEGGSPAPSDAGPAAQCPGTWKCQSVTLAGPNCVP